MGDRLFCVYMILTIFNYSMFFSRLIYDQTFLDEKIYDAYSPSVPALAAFCVPKLATGDAKFGEFSFGIDVSIFGGKGCSVF